MARAGKEEHLSRAFLPQRGLRERPARIGHFDCQTDRGKVSKNVRQILAELGRTPNRNTCWRIRDRDLEMAERLAELCRDSGLSLEHLEVPISHRSHLTSETEPLRSDPLFVT